jgi:hypothetical protein
MEKLKLISSSYAYKNLQLYLVGSLNFLDVPSTEFVGIFLSFSQFSCINQCERRCKLFFKRIHYWYIMIEAC